MATFDVRNTAVDEIDEIRFADGEDYYVAIAMIINYEGDGDSMVCDNDGNSVRIHSKTHAHNLIKALEKAIELDWLKD